MDEIGATNPRTALVFGGTGQIGVPLLPRLHAAGWQVIAVSRQPQAAQPGVHWLTGGFERCDGLPERVDAIFSLGPLDRFSAWYAQGDVQAPRVVAFGSTSVDTKLDSADAHERDLVARLQTGEARVFDTARQRGAHATVLRPTLVYGAGRDQTLARIALLARRTGVFVLPRGACGLRQPVHVDDLAAAAVDVLDRPATYSRAYALPGGETLPYREMVARTLAAMTPPARLIEVPAGLFRGALAVARWRGRMQGLTDAAVDRMRRDMVFDASPAATEFGYAPRGFSVDARALP